MKKVTMKSCCVLLVIGVLLSGIKMDTVRAKSSKDIKKQNKSALTAYGKLLSGKEYRYGKDGKKFKFGIVDINQDGISELVIHSDGNDMAGIYAEIYIYKNGKANQAGLYCRSYPTIYKDGVVQYRMGHSGSDINTYEKIRKGRMKIVCGYEGLEEAEWKNWGKKVKKEYNKKLIYSDDYIKYCKYIKVNGKNVSGKKFVSWEKRYQNKAEEVKIKFLKI